MARRPFLNPGRLTNEPARRHSDSRVAPRQPAREEEDEAMPADAPPFDIYRNSPAFTAPENLITDIHLPLKAKRP